MSLCALTSPKATHQQGLLVISQSLLSQVTLPLDLQLQGLRDVGNHPVDDTQDEEHHMLRMSTQSGHYIENVNCHQQYYRNARYFWIEHNTQKSYSHIFS